jgi:hypothetical protein
MARSLRCKFRIVMPFHFLTTLQVLSNRQNTDWPCWLSSHPWTNCSGARCSNYRRMRLIRVPHKLSYNSLHRADLLGFRELEQWPSCEQLHIATAHRLFPQRQSSTKLHHRFFGCLHPECAACARKASSAESSCHKHLSRSANLDSPDNFLGICYEGGPFSSCRELN